MNIQKKGISLIVLVITIIVMIILAATIIINLSDNKIMDNANKAVNESNLKEVQTAASLGWMEAFTETSTEQKNDSYYTRKVNEYLTNNGIDPTDYNITVSTTGASVSKKVISATVGGAPIPVGFTASDIAGENSAPVGLVIYEGTEKVSTDTDAKTTRNQYVWVPVSLVMFESQFGSFVRRPYGTTLSNTPGTNYWEIALDTTTNMPLLQQNSTYISAETLAEAQAMYKSVKKYGGFYIARYEMGLDAPISTFSLKTGSDVKSMQNKYAYNFLNWNSAVQVARSLYPAENETGVISTLTYGVQWDTVCFWCMGAGVPGNFPTTEISSNVNAGAKYSSSALSMTYSTYNNFSSKTTSESYLLTTGAWNNAIIKNIYDMSGNLGELTMERCDQNLYTIRGGNYMTSIGMLSLLGRANGTGGLISTGARASLYIKL